MRRLALALVVASLAGCHASSPRAPKSPVVVLGLDGADWQLIDGYLADGTMPNLASIVREGHAGILETIEPPLSPLVWTSMVTGVSPLEHRVLDFTRFHPGSGVREPITSDERAVPALWNMATASGASVAVFGVWATYPAERVKGLLVSDRLFSFQNREASPPPGIVFPAGREGWARDSLAAVAAKVDAAALRAYLPWLGEDEASFPAPAGSLRRILVETRVYDALAREVFRRDVPDLTFLYVQGTDTIGHVFAPYAPPRLESIPPEEFERYRGVPPRYFAEIDALIGAWRDLARARGARLLICSDHGFAWGEGRPRRVASNEAPTAGRWHRNEGLYVVWGSGIGASGARDRGSILQVAPTVLALMGLPQGRGMPAPLAGAPPAVLPERDWRDGWSPPEPPRAADEGDAATVANLRALGYIGSAEPAVSHGERRTAGSWNNEGLLLRAAGRVQEAARAFDEAMRVDPRLASPRWNLSELLEAWRIDPARSDALLVEALSLGLPDGERAVASRAAVLRGGDPGRAGRLIEQAVAAKPTSAPLWLLAGRNRMDARNCAGAKEAFEKATALAPQDPVAFGSLAIARVCLGDRAGAEQAVRRSLALDPDQPALRRVLNGR